ncbi:MAG: J domain-containing protein [Candidatus Scalindua sp.]|nr:J domain-containing protein [Candidatus Scalindua sp.]
MNKFDACKILGISGLLSSDLVKVAIRKATTKFHPDRNPAGLEMMKLVNEAKRFFSDFAYETEASIDLTDAGRDYGDLLNAAINAVINLPNVTTEVCGIWVWLSGDTRAVKDTIKSAGFHWASKKKKWYFRPSDYKSKSRGKYSMDDIRKAHGSETLKPIHRTAIAG